MVEDQVLSKDEKKFEFDMHNFDEEEYIDPYAEEEEEVPSFSEEELEAAKKQAFEEGKKQGLDESKASRDQKIAQLLETISTQYAPLVEAENAREKIYELESVKLCHAVIEKLFPIYAKKCGLDEIKQAVSTIINRHQGQSKINITVTPEAQEAIQTHINTATEGQETQFEVGSDESLDIMTCRLQWSDGGAVKNAHKMAEEILTLIEESLAAQGVSVHDTEEKESTSEEPEEEHSASEEQKEEQNEEQKPGLQEDNETQAPPDEPIEEKTEEPGPEMEKQNDDG